VSEGQVPGANVASRSPSSTGNRSRPSSQSPRLRSSDKHNTTEASFTSQEPNRDPPSNSSVSSPSGIHVFGTKRLSSQCKSLDCAHDQLSLDATGSTCSGQFVCFERSSRSSANRTLIILLRRSNSFATSPVGTRRTLIHQRSLAHVICNDYFPTKRCHF